MSGRTEATLKETVRLIEAAGGSGRFVIADLAVDMFWSTKSAS